VILSKSFHPLKHSSTIKRRILPPGNGSGEHRETRIIKRKKDGDFLKKERYFSSGETGMNRFGSHPNNENLTL
jgi:hypothetical protein